MTFDGEMPKLARGQLLEGEVERYSAVGIVGESEFAELIAARETGTPGVDSWVAIKRPQRRFLPTREDAAAFLARIYRVSRARHDNINSIADAGMADDGAYLISPWLHGETLRAMLTTLESLGRLMRAELAAYIGAAICDALEFAHLTRDTASDEPLLHGNLRPENIVLTFAGTVKVTDLGLDPALRLDRREHARNPSQVGYLAPERGRGDPPSHSADLFGLGVILWEAVTGKPLFRGKDVAATLAAVRECHVPPVRELSPETPPDFAGIVSRCLAKLSPDRYPTAYELGRDLRRFLAAHQSTLSPSELGRLMRQTFPRSAKDASPLGKVTRPISLRIAAPLPIPPEAPDSSLPYADQITQPPVRSGEAGVLSFEDDPFRSPADSGDKLPEPAEIPSAVGPTEGGNVPFDRLGSAIARASWPMGVVASQPAPAVPGVQRPSAPVSALAATLSRPPSVSSPLPSRPPSFLTPIPPRFSSPQGAAPGAGIIPPAAGPSRPPTPAGSIVSRPPPTSSAPLPRAPSVVASAPPRIPSFIAPARSPSVVAPPPSRPPASISGWSARPSSPAAATPSWLGANEGQAASRPQGGVNGTPSRPPSMIRPALALDERPAESAFAAPVASVPPPTNGRGPGSFPPTSAEAAFGPGLDRPSRPPAPLLSGFEPDEGETQPGDEGELRRPPFLSDDSGVFVAPSFPGPVDPSRALVSLHPPEHAPSRPPPGLWGRPNAHALFGSDPPLPPRLGQPIERSIDGDDDVEALYESSAVHWFHTLAAFGRSRTLLSGLLLVAVALLVVVVVQLLTRPTVGMPDPPPRRVEQARAQPAEGGPAPQPSAPATATPVATPREAAPAVSTPVVPAAAAAKTPAQPPPSAATHPKPTPPVVKPVAARPPTPSVPAPASVSPPAATLPPPAAEPTPAAGDASDVIADPFQAEAAQGSQEETDEGEKRGAQLLKDAARAEARGDAIGARKSLEACANEDLVPECHRELGHVLAGIGERKGAAAHYRRYLNLLPDADDAVAIEKRIFALEQ